MPKVGVRPAYARYLKGFTSVYGLGSQAVGTAGRVYLIPVDIPWSVVIDRIGYMTGAVSAGNVRLGIYREGATPDSPAGGVLVVETASVAQGAIQTLQLVVIANTLLTRGQYFLGVQGDDIAGSFWRSYDEGGVLSLYYDRAGGYGAFTTPCPAVAISPVTPWLLVRVKTNLGL